MAPKKTKGTAMSFADFTSMVESEGRAGCSLGSADACSSGLQDLLGG